MTMAARFPGTCTVCGCHIRPGQSIDWQAGAGARHATCRVGKNKIGGGRTPAAAPAPRRAAASRAPLYGTCDSCGAHGRLVSRTDSSGIRGHVCDACGRQSAAERSYY